MEIILQDERTDVNQADYQGFTPLIEASFNGMTEVVKLLLQCRDTDIEKVDENGMTALDYALDRGYTDIINAFESRDQLVLENGETCPRTTAKATWYTISMELICIFGRRWEGWVSCIGTSTTGTYSVGH